jgi:hypothetical protein
VTGTICSQETFTRTGTLFFLDLDGFKDVNDNHGHHAGDAVILDIASRLESILPGGAILGRLGGRRVRDHTAGSDRQQGRSTRTRRYRESGCAAQPLARLPVPSACTVAGVPRQVPAGAA